MGQNSVLNNNQRLILDEFKKEERLSSFYFTGGTALSEYYLKHRESVDLDFFTKESFDPQMILEIVTNWSKVHELEIKPEFVDPTYIYTLKFRGGDILKIDFTKYPYPNLEKPNNFNGVKVDSLFDIAVNKLLTINQRTEVKDFVDIFFLSEKFNFWQLKDGVATKFNIEIDPYLMSIDYMKVDFFENLPTMLKNLDLETLKNFFRNQAKKLGGEEIK